jgi:hypothetical protein
MRRTWFSGDAEHTTNHPEAGTCRPRVHKHAEGEGWTVCCPVHLHLQPLYLADWAEAVAHANRHTAWPYALPRAQGPWHLDWCECAHEMAELEPCS